MGGFSSDDALLDITPAQAGEGLGVGKHEGGGAAGADSLLDLGQPEESNADKKPGMDNNKCLINHYNFKLYLMATAIYLDSNWESFI